MKALLAICLIVTATFVWADENSAPSPQDTAAVSGKVLEARNVENYTYLRLMTLEGETWAAIPRTPVRKGAAVTVENVTVMNNFESKTLKKTFPTILFGTLGSPPGSAPNARFMGSAYPVFGKTPDAGTTVQSPRASGANARTVEEILSKGGQLKDQPVLVRGKVVKYTPGIMGKNWVHLRDGTGSAADNTNDLIVITTHETKIGDVVTAKGIVRNNKDVGIGVIYKVLVEDAALQK